jgi:hypothetical protein
MPAIMSQNIATYNSRRVSCRFENSGAVSGTRKPATPTNQSNHPSATTSRGSGAYSVPRALGTLAYDGGGALVVSCPVCSIATRTN